VKVTTSCAKTSSVLGQHPAARAIHLSTSPWAPKVSLETDGKFLAVSDENAVAVDKESSLTEFTLDIKDG